MTTSRSALASVATNVNDRFGMAALPVGAMNVSGPSCMMAAAMASIAAMAMITAVAVIAAMATTSEDRNGQKEGQKKKESSTTHWAFLSALAGSRGEAGFGTCLARNLLERETREQGKFRQLDRETPELQACMLDP